MPVNKDRVREYNKAYYNKHKQELLEKSSLYYQENRKDIISRVSDYKKRNPDKVREVIQKNKGKYTKRVLQRRKENKVSAILSKGGKCEVCGLEYNGSNAACFDFHHTDPLQKEWDPSTALRLSKIKMEEELSKCKLVCANCHRLAHFEKY